jgi:hypothetical protein
LENTTTPLRLTSKMPPLPWSRSTFA